MGKGVICKRNQRHRQKIESLYSDRSVNAAESWNDRSLESNLFIGFRSVASLLQRKTFRVCASPFRVIRV